MRTHLSFRYFKKYIAICTLNRHFFFLIKKCFKCEHVLDKCLQTIKIIHVLYSYSWNVLVLGECIPCGRRQNISRFLVGKYEEYLLPTISRE